MAELDGDVSVSQVAEDDLISEKNFTPRPRSMNILQDEKQSSGEIYTPRTVASSDSVGLEGTSGTFQVPTIQQSRAVAQLDHPDRPREFKNSSEVTQTLLYDVQFTPALTSEAEAVLSTNDHSPPPVMSPEKDSDSHNEEEHSNRSECIGGTLHSVLGANTVEINSTVDESANCDHNTSNNRTVSVSGQHASTNRTVSVSGQHASTNRTVSVSGQHKSVAQTRNESGHDQLVTQTNTRINDSGHCQSIDENITTSDSTQELSQSSSVNRTLNESGQHQSVTQTTLRCPTIQSLDSTSQSSAISSPIATPTGPPSSQSLSTELGVSPYVVVKDGLVNVGLGQFESPGLLYARSMKEKHNLDLLRPADEVAEDVLEMILDEEDDSTTRHQQLNWSDEEDEGQGEGEQEDEMVGDDRISVGEREGERRDSEVSVRRRRRSRQSSETKTHHRVGKSGVNTSLVSIGESTDPMLIPLDPRVLRDLEKQARKIASNLEYIMDNLHNSLHAMTVCAKQSVLLHRESVDNLHSIVDANIKASYNFLAKFEELNRRTLPLSDLAQQINDIDRILKIFEKNFRTP